MKKHTLIFILFFTPFIPLVLQSFSKGERSGVGIFAQVKTKSWTKKPFERKVFIENKGQYAADLPPTKTNFSYCIDNGSKVFFYNNEVLFYFSKSGLKKENFEEENDVEEERKREAKLQKTEKQFVSMKWLNANPNATIEVVDEQKTDYGYVIREGVPKSYTAHCRGYSKIKIKNLYNGIDIEYFFNEKEGFKYNVYINAGADISQIQQYYEGAKNIKLKDGNIVIKTIEGDIIDHAPASFYKEGGNIESTFELKNNTVSFKLNQLITNNSQPSIIVIDPWVSTPTMPQNPVDNGVDQYGNSYITSPHYVLEKYSPTGVLISSTNVVTATYYGDMLTDSRGYCFFNTMSGGQPSGDATAVDSAGNFLWNSYGITECWRFVLNECNHQVLSLTGYRHSSTGFAKINTTNGSLTGYTQSGACCQDPHCGVIDYNSDVYCVVSENGGGTVIYKWTPANTIAATYPAVGSWGYGTGYVGDGFFSQGYNGMTILGKNLYIFDGATLFKVNKTTGAIVQQVTVPGGINKHNGGIYITSCGKIFVGSSTGVYMYDINFNQISFQATTGAVYDLAFNTFSQTISVCGPGHVTELSFVIPPCVFQTAPLIQPSCGGLPNGFIKLNLTGGVPDYTYTWSNNGTVLAQITDSIGNLTPGTYKCVYSDNKCPIPNTDSISIVVPLVTTHAAFTFNDVCSPAANLLTDSSYVNSGSVNSWSWKFGDGSTSAQPTLSHTYASSGTYSVQLAVKTTDGCKDSITKSVTVFPKPIADFTFTNQCNATAVPFNSTSTIGVPGVISNWDWDFGDTTSSTGSTTSHTFTHPGNFNVTLITNSSHSCADTNTHQITVFNNPVVGFTHNDVCFRDTMHFANNTTVNSPAAIASYLWNFGDGSATSNLVTPVHYYTTAGTFNVTLVATTADGCSNAVTNPVNVFDPPTSAFTVANTCLFDSAIFTNTSLNPVMGSISSWVWNFGDGSPATTLTGFQTLLGVLYAAPGNYQITLITHSSNLGCPDTLKSTLTVYPMPVAKFSFVNVCLNQPMNFHDSSTVSNGSVTGWLWNFGDTSPLITIQNPAHIYANPGTYTVTLIATTNNGCKDTISKTVVVHPLPVAQFSRVNVCDGTTIQFNDLSSILATDTIQTWTWNFGDANPLNTNQNTSHLYAANGSYPVQLLIVSKFGCKDSITKTTIVHPNPVVNFKTPDTVGCELWCVHFTDTSSIATGVNATWMWSFGDGGPTSNSINPVHCYNNNSLFAPIRYSLTLTVTSDSGCSTTKSVNNFITVYPNPNANFSVQPQTATFTDPVVSITDLSTGANFWYWNFGDHDTTSLHNPLQHTYKDTGSYVITLITSTIYNCFDTAYQNIYVEPDFLFYIPNSFSPNDDGINDGFSGKGVFIKEYEMSIYDRWGNLIFFTDDLKKQWDGKANHGTEIAQRDVYVYSIQIIDLNKRKHSYKGIVTLLR